LAGVPDLVVAGPGGLIWRELKSAAGTLTPEQTAWKWRLLACDQDYAIWRPQEWAIDAVRRQINALYLSRTRQPATTAKR